MRYLSTLLIIIIFVATSCGNGKEEKKLDKKEQVTKKEEIKKSKTSIKKRGEIDEKYKWKVEDIYKDVEEWNASAKKLKSQFDDLQKFKGNLEDDAKTFLNCLNLYWDMNKELYRLHTYANMRADEDTKNTTFQALKDRCQTLETDFDTVASFIEPEITSIENSKIQEFINSEGKLKIYEHYLENLMRQKPHIRTVEEEKIIAQSNSMGSAPENIYDIFQNSDLDFPVIKDEKGNEVKLSNAQYVKYRSSSNREVRKNLFNTFWKTYDKYKNTFATMLNSQIKRDKFYAEVRNHDSCLKAALFPENIPTEVYINLVKTINKNLDSFYRYLELRKKMLGVDKLHYYDIYPSIIKSINIKYPYDDSQKLIKEACKKLGKEYVEALDEAFKGRWTDVYPNVGKRSGAYMTGSAYDVHPYMLLNYGDTYDSLSTFTHELGHAMHSYFTNKTQPFLYHNYSTFIAEIASTLDEILLNKYMIKNAKSDEEKVFILGQLLETMRGTIFRQVMFAEFELEIHKMVEEGKPLTSESLNKLYRSLVERYHGVQKGHLEYNPLYSVEWSYIPHFYYNFYVYQYATSLIAAFNFVEKFEKEGQPAIDKYLELLKNGAKDYPIELLKEAGVDMTKPEVIESFIKVFNDTMDQIEQLTAKK